MNALPLLLFGDDLDHFEMETPVYTWYKEPQPRRWPSIWDLAHMKRQELAKPTTPIGKDGFQVSIGVEHFQPNELQVKVVDNHILVEAKHEEKSDDHGFISRHIVRRYAIPKGYDAHKVVSSLSSDGILTVSIPKPELEGGKTERVIQIQQTGAAHLNIKDNPKEDEAETEKDKK